MKTALIINAHLKWEGMSEGRLNRTFFELAIKTLESLNIEVQTTYIEKGYNLDEEVDKHVWADLVITQTPIYWFNAPWIHKKYIDEVFSNAHPQKKLLVSDGRTRKDPSKQYGTGGLSQGKKYLLSATWNAPEVTFGHKEQLLMEGKTTDEVLINLSNVYKFCGFEILKGFYAYDVVKNPNIKRDTKRLKEYLTQIVKEK